MAIRLGELLLKAKVISDAQLETALAEQGKWGGQLGQILVRMDYLTEDLLTKALSRLLGLPRADLANTTPQPLALKKLGARLANQYTIVPLELQDGGETLVVATSDPNNLETLDAIRAATGVKAIVTLLAGESEVKKAIEVSFSAADLRDTEGEEFKIVDIRGNTMMKPISEIQAEGEAIRKARGKPAPPPPPPVAEEPARASSSRDPIEILKQVEKNQRTEVQVLKAIVELLIERGVFSRDEYLAKVSRR